MLSKHVRALLRILTGNLDALYAWGLGLTNVICIIAGVGTYSLWVQLLLLSVKIILELMHAYQEVVVQWFAYVPYAIFKETDRVYTVYKDTKQLSCTTLMKSLALQLFALDTLDVTVPCVKLLYRWGIQLHFLFWLSVTVVHVLPFVICSCLHVPSEKENYALIKLKHEQCMEQMTMPSMSALAVVANFKPQLQVSLRLVFVILLLQFIVLIADLTLLSAVKQRRRSLWTSLQHLFWNTRFRRQRNSCTWTDIMTDIMILVLSILHLDCLTDFKPLVVKMHTFLILCFQNMCLVVLTLGVHGYLERTVVFQHFFMLFVIFCLQVHIEDPKRSPVRKLLIVVFGKMLFPRNFCPTASTIFAKVPVNTTVEMMTFEKIDDDSRLALTCAGFLPGICTDANKNIHGNIRLAIDFCVFMSFFIHIVLANENKRKTPQASPISITVRKVAHMWSNDLYKTLCQSSSTAQTEEKRTLYSTFQHWKICAKSQVFQKIDTMKLESKVSDANLNKIENDILLCQNLYMCMSMLDRLVKHM